MSLKLVNRVGESISLSDLFLVSKELKIRGKFVVVEKDGVLNVRLFSMETIHEDVAKRLCAQLSDGVFVAAGKYYAPEDFYNVWYDSDTCWFKYGKDQPTDPAEAKKLLGEINALLSSE